MSTQMKVVNKNGMDQIREWLQQVARADKPWLTTDLTVSLLATDAENDVDGLLELPAVDCALGVPSTLIISSEGFDQVEEEV